MVCLSRPYPFKFFVASIAAHFAKYEKNGVSVFDTTKITFNFVLGEDEIRHPDFNGNKVANNVQYYHNRHIRYCRIERKRQSLLKKKAKLAQITESYPPLNCLTSRQTSFSINRICMLCGKSDRM